MAISLRINGGNMKKQINIREASISGMPGSSLRHLLYLPMPQRGIQSILSARLRTMESLN
ncbi:MAG TPA: hypothetical protein DDW27_03205 [Bacteroidales bacterium]|nr:hypothetical protein [Bacteroidales bacterium]